MGLFRKKKRPKYVDELWSSNAPEPHVQGAATKPAPAAAQQKNTAMEYCEQILTAAKALEETKRDYKIATDYLTDIQKIEDLPEKEFAEIQEVAQHVVELNRTRDDYLNKSRNISDAQFAQMEQLEEQMPSIIRRLKENEAYQTTVKRDMQYLEGEKGEWVYYLDSLEREKKLLPKLLYALIGIFTAVEAAIVITGILMEFEIGMPFLIAALAAGGLGCLMVLRLQKDRAEARKAQANINRAIVLLNKVKFKFVNVTNAVDFACERYHVKIAYELNYIWEQ